MVTNPRILDLSSCRVSEGVRSSAARITGSSESMPPSTTPNRLFRIRLATSLMFAARACIYASSIAANMAANWMPACSTAYSALQDSSSIRDVIHSTKSSSSTIMAWVSKRTAISSPASSWHFSAKAFSCRMDCS